MYFRGLEFEDSVVISKSAAEKLTHMGEHIMTYTLNDREEIVEILKPGTRVKSRDPLVKVEEEITLTKQQRELKDLVVSKQKTIRDKSLLVPPNIEDALVIDVKYVKVKDHASQKAKLDEISGLDYRDSNGQESEFTAKYGPTATQKIIPPSKILNPEPDVTYVVFIKILIANETKDGDKLTNRYGSKGVVGRVVPDHLMPKSVETGKVVEIIINPSSVIARKNLPQVGEANLTLISRKIWEMVDEVGVEKKNWDKIKALLKKYHFNSYRAWEFEKFKEYHESLRNSDVKYRVITGSFSKFSPRVISEILEELNISDKEYLVDGMRGRKIKAPIQTGYSYIMKLHHMAEFQNKVTIEDPRDRDPLVLGKGAIRSTGQSLGDMESVALLIHGASDYLRDVRGSMHNDWFLTNMLASGFVVTDAEGTPMLSEFRSKKKELRSKYL
jgi:DNA-directed RNA polymerase beta subunit